MRLGNNIRDICSNNWEKIELKTVPYPVQILHGNVHGKSLHKAGLPTLTFHSADSVDSFARAQIIMTFNKYVPLKLNSVKDPRRKLIKSRRCLHKLKQID